LNKTEKRHRLNGHGGAGYPFDPSQPGTWDAVETRRYVWDGYNIAAEIVIDEVTPSTNVTYYTWGLDLSGTLQGAGGVGGLLAVTTADLDQPDSLTTYYPCYDANGNITEYVDGSGNIRAHYEYSPFGEIVVQSGDLADTFLFRFSTKPWCPITGLSEYELRKYRPDLGRWLSREPLGESASHNLHSFLNNRLLQMIDVLGLYGNPVSGPNGPVGPANPYAPNPWDKTPPPPGFRWYGFWGGPGWANGEWRPESGPLPKPGDPRYRSPIDQRDACYEGHDQCINGCPKCPKKANSNCIKGCDHTLAKCLYRVGKFFEGRQSKCFVCKFN